MDNDKVGSKLMIPLFYGRFFNREGHKMRAVFEREVSNGSVTYRIWRSTGKPKVTYPNAENDKHFLYIEVNGYLLPLGMTGFFLVASCGNQAAINKLYGGMEKRSQYFNLLRETEGDAGIAAALDIEKMETVQCGNDPICQTEYIQKLMDEHVSVYLKAKESNGMTFPDFRGAAVMNEIEICTELASVYWAAQREKKEAREAQDKMFCEERNGESERLVAEALEIIRNDGILKNEIVKFYRSKYSFKSWSIVNYLMWQYQVDVPLSTQLWINNKLSAVIIEDGKCERLQYFHHKNGRCSQKFFDCMNNLIRAVKAHTSDQAEEVA